MERYWIQFSNADALYLFFGPDVPTASLVVVPPPVVGPNSNASAPCCTWGCTPWPECCGCDKINNTVTHQDLFDHYMK